MPVRSAQTKWRGSLQDGDGDVNLVSSGAGTFNVSFPRRAADDAEGVTSPEELIAAAHSACYAMQLSAMIARADGTPEILDVKADVELAPDPEGGFRIAGILITVRARLSGLDDDTFAAVAEEAKRQCPVSKALTGTTVTLDAALV